MRLSALAITACIAVALPAAAHAGTVTMDSSPGPAGYDDQAWATYTAAGGEQNDLTVTVEYTPDEGQTVLYEDSGAPVDAGDGCEQVGTNAARCQHPGLFLAEVKAGDQDDVVKLISTTRNYFNAYGEAGDDELIGSAKLDNLDGGTGEDALRGGGQHDSLYGGADSDDLDGGAGNDRVSGDGAAPDGQPGSPATDRLAGGRGSDTVRYERSTPIDVDLERTGGNGAPGENDELSGFENIYGGIGGGRLAGDAGPNVIQAFGRSETTLVGRAGDDRLTGFDGDEVFDGGRGADFLTGGGGSDKFRAGPGPDTLQIASIFPAGDHPPWSRVQCGRGPDRVTSTRWHDAIAPGCDLVDLNVFGVRPTIRRVDADTLEVRLRRLVPRGMSGVCRGVVALFAPYPQEAGPPPHRRIVDTEAARVFLKRDTRVRLQLNDYGRELLDRRPNVPILVRAGTTKSCEGPVPGVPSAGFTAKLRNPD